MGMFDSFNVNASGLTAQRYRMDVISQNVANANTTRTEDGTPYVRKIVTFEEKQGSFGTFSSVFGQTMCQLAMEDSRVCAITAAMPFPFPVPARSAGA